MLGAVAVSAVVVAHVAVSDPAVMRAEQKLAAARSTPDAIKLSRDFVEVGVDGRVVTALERGERVILRDVKVQLVGDTAVTTGTQDGTRPARFVRVWRKRVRGWVVELSHLTPIGQAPAGHPARWPKTLPPTVWPVGGSAAERAIIAAQRTLNETFAARDVAAYAALTAEKFVRITPEGRVIGRAEFLKELESAGGPAARRDPNHSEFRLRIYGSIAALTYANRAGDLQRVTRLFVSERGKWLQLVTQATRVLE